MKLGKLSHVNLREQCFAWDKRPDRRISGWIRWKWKEL